MTKEQRDWYEYGYARALNDIYTGEFAGDTYVRAAWDARKKAHRWNNTIRFCTTCEHVDTPLSKSPCNKCDHNYNLWAPNEDT